MRTDHLVIGSGVAGLTYAIKMAEKFPERSITIVTKAEKEESNTRYAQGGVAVVMNNDRDSFTKHVEDTLKAGDGLCDRNVVEMVVAEGPDRLEELITWGVRFDRDQQGNLALGREGGHSEYRIVHHKDITGYEIEKSLLYRVKQLSNIRMLDHHFAIDLITEHHYMRSLPESIHCYGAYVLDQQTGRIITLLACTTLLATGGIGRVYGHTTNPCVATGDGIAMAYRAKARVKDMEFVQFHPTVFYERKDGKSFLISEAVRGYGARLRNHKGERFMFHYDKRGELASRDIVSMGIDRELKKSGEECVYLDCTHLPEDDFRSHFPNIYAECMHRHIDPATDWIPVLPASHYLCGGIEVDTGGRTTVGNLYACGECSRTGLHGANRLASNSLLEALVYSHNIFKIHSELIPANPGWNHAIPDWNHKGTEVQREHVIIGHNRKKLQALMRDYVGIVRSDKRLELAGKNLENIYEEVESLYRESKVSTALCELRNMVNIAHLIICQSSGRTENRGGFFNMDNTGDKIPEGDKISVKTRKHECTKSGITFALIG